MNLLTQLVRELIDEDQTILTTAASLPKGRHFLRRELERAEHEIAQGRCDGWPRKYADRIKEALAEQEAEA